MVFFVSCSILDLYIVRCMNLFLPLFQISEIVSLSLGYKEFVWVSSSIYMDWFLMFILLRHLDFEGHEEVGAVLSYSVWFCSYPNAGYQSILSPIAVRCCLMEDNCNILNWIGYSWILISLVYFWIVCFCFMFCFSVYAHIILP